MAAQPPDHAKQLLMQKLAQAKTEANGLGAALAASLIGMAILSISPTWTDGNTDPMAGNDNRSQSDKR